MIVFKKDFLENLQEQCGSKTMIDHYMNDLGMSFQDSILRFANFHQIKPQYYLEGDKHDETSHRINPNMSNDDWLKTAMKMNIS